MSRTSQSADPQFRPRRRLSRQSTSVSQSFEIGSVPQSPAIYLLEDFKQNAAYVGMSEKLQDRLKQHFIRRDSSVTTGVSAAVLNIDQVRCARWWLHETFSDPVSLNAAELVAFDVFEPTLRSLGRVSAKVRKLYQDPEFNRSARDLFTQPSNGEYHPLNLRNLLARIESLEQKVDSLSRVLPKNE
jgi:hypothetical protein